MLFCSVICIQYHNSCYFGNGNLYVKTRYGEQPIKIYSGSSSLSCSGNITFANCLQPRNAQHPMRVTLLGIVTLVSPVRSSNALAPMLVTPSGIVTFASPLGAATIVLPSLVSKSPDCDLYEELPVATINAVRPLQPENA